jgi:hypothetical protein
VSKPAGCAVRGREADELTHRTAPARQGAPFPVTAIVGFSLGENEQSYTGELVELVVLCVTTTYRNLASVFRVGRMCGTVRDAATQGWPPAR